MAEKKFKLPLWQRVWIDFCCAFLCIYFALLELIAHLRSRPSMRKNFTLSRAVGCEMSPPAEPGANDVHRLKQKEVTRDG